MQTRVREECTNALIFSVPPNPRVTFAIVHEDDAIIVVDKPARLASQSNHRRVWDRVHSLLEVLTFRGSARSPATRFG